MTHEANTDVRFKTRNRIILGASCLQEAEPAMEVAIALAKQMGSELHGLLVRDARFALRNRTHPLALVSFAGAPINDASESDVAAAFSIHAHGFEQKLLDAASGASLSAVFDYAEGSLGEKVQDTAQPGDFVVFGFPRTRPSSNILLLSLAEQEDVPDFAARLAMDQHLQIRILRIDPVRSSKSSPGAQDRRAQTDTTLKDRTNGLADVLENQAAAVLIVTAAAAAGIPRRLIVDAARCPVVFAIPDN